jgi:hypothetical protein
VVVLPVPPLSDRTAIVSAIEDGHDTEAVGGGGRALVRCVRYSVVAALIGAGTLTVSR